ncbi:MAG: hypothetical protein ACJAV2_003609 [Myxococcota bacterium]|jgi:hypothetical protein
MGRPALRAVIAMVVAVAGWREPAEPALDVHPPCWSGCDCGNNCAQFRTTAPTTLTGSQEDL